MHLPTLLALVLVVLTAACAVADEDLVVLRPRASDPKPDRQVHAWLMREANEALARRETGLEKVTTPEHCADYQRRLREFFLEQLGPFPQRTPLNARTVGREERDGYRIEKVILESQPGFHVTGVLYLPEGQPPFPAVLHPCGHSENGKAHEAYQRASILLAKHGLAVFNYDPVGQGERKQLLDAEGKGRFRATAEHSLYAPGSILLGRNAASFMIWDGIRSIDYLVSRRDVDATRIGCCGNSGGGTQTSYLMALDNRIASAAPNCYLTGFQRLLETIGPQDAEQNIHGQVAAGLDHADYLILRAPKPSLIGAATRDFFDIGGTWQTFRQAKRFYERLGFPERMDLAETDTTHGFTRGLRIATVRWMRRWLLGKDDAVTEGEFPVVAEEALRCTPRGQVLYLDGARTLFDLNRDLEARLSGERERIWRADSEAALRDVRRLAGIRPLAQLTPPVADRLGTLQRDGYRIEKLALQAEAGLQLPALDFLPDRPTGDVTLYLHGDGKAGDARPGGRIEELVRTGHRVLAVDLRGLGEHQARNERGEAQGTSGRDVMLAYLLGRSFIGLRAEDTLRCARYVVPAERDRTRLHLVAIGEAGPPALHAAALEPGLFASVRLVQSLGSWADVVRIDTPGSERVHSVHGALRHYDLPDLVRTLGQRITVVEPRVPAGSRPGPEE